MAPFTMLEVRNDYYDDRRSTIVYCDNIDKGVLDQLLQITFTPKLALFR